MSDGNNMEPLELECPLTQQPCKKDRCAWYATDTGECAIVTLAALGTAMCGHIDSASYPPAIRVWSE